MRKVSAAALILIALCAGPAGAEDLKAFKLTIDGVTVDIDPGESADVTLPGGKRSKVTLERNDFATFSGSVFSFVHPSNISVTKTDIGDDITQYLMASALGTIVVVQEYGAMNPVSLNQLMLQEMTKESVQAGATLTQEPTTRKLADGKELTGIHAEVKTRTDTADFEIVGVGLADRGLLFITRIAGEDAATEKPLVDKFWQSLKVKLQRD
ncbi:MAG: hypothetical protein EOS73_32040 [Mesorhizobium sp.]|uniref:hypothetical protein n=1 Tax=unclassified Mesorhizobium TaxID=325217 RepID=UPI000FD26806|nr:MULTISPECIES: hypothetical protein [unclassified Mesorhizobium]AZV20571.1 hypothetical protein EJ079_16775 [Mesorhizobium sp. M7A.F.Ce.TU.012.03.2.1]RVD12154.1 hypothetical protein EN749_28740 [Mesorhizobium sp. M7A.F.Ca.ET.027.02.1.1]RWC98092.1 MAG: hypothetical protein EOS73_32040 [Mesorhizobium sp.]RWP90707.1 MAG: hypothetical protein EOR12_09505 [Mesorhizobium sp.]TIM95028.1 MAG: hypothetical protein E5Y34_27765 [Mesorhizobium sp.]